MEASIYDKIWRSWHIFRKLLFLTCCFYVNFSWRIMHQRRDRPNFSARTITRLRSPGFLKRLYIAVPSRSAFADLRRWYATRVSSVVSNHFPSSLRETSVSFTRTSTATCGLSWKSHHKRSWVSSPTFRDGISSWISCWNVGRLLHNRLDVFPPSAVKSIRL